FGRHGARVRGLGPEARRCHQAAHQVLKRPSIPSWRADLMIDKLAIFGATGDLTARYLLPALASLRASGQLSENFQLIAVGREDWSKDDLLKWADEQLGRHAGQLHS